MGDDGHRNGFLSDDEQSELLKDFIEVTLPDEDSFLKIRETLTRIGLKSRRRDNGDKPILYQSCHILHKRGKHYIVHFKELFKLDGKTTNFEEDDLKRRNTIAKMLENWRLCEVVNKRDLEPSYEVSYALESKKLVVLPYKVKDKFHLEPKYNLGKFKSKREF